MKQVSKRIIALALAVCLISAGAAYAMTTSSLGITGPCYETLTMTGSGTEMAVTWWDNVDAAEAFVRYGTDPELGEYTQTEAAVTRTSADSSAVNYAYSIFTATMTGLTPGTTYYYQVGSTNGETGIGAVRSFVMADPSQNDYAFLYMGDIQYDTALTAEEDYAAWDGLLQAAMTNANNLYGGVAFGMFCGDLVQQGQSAADWQRLLKYSSKVFDSVPMMAVPGNHESNNGGYATFFEQELALPHNGPAGFETEFYSFDYGPCHYTCLPSNILSSDRTLTDAERAAIRGWITADLQNSTATWKIVVMHHPTYAVVEDTVANVVLQEWEPIFVEQQVDLVLCGHQHIYMRTKAIDGVTYVMANSGSKHYASADVSYSAVMLDSVSTYQLIHVTGDTLTLTTYNAAGTELDSVTLSPKDRSEPYIRTVTGDLNGDGVLTDADVQLLLNAILSCAAYSDVNDYNGDGAVDIVDAHRLALTVQEGVTE